MERVHIFRHHVKRWPRPVNHLDMRLCPSCGGPVFGSEGQRLHHERHLAEQEFQLRVLGWLREFAKRTGIAEEEIGDDWAWGAEVTGVEDEIEAAE